MSWTNEMNYVNTRHKEEENTAHLGNQLIIFVKVHWFFVFFLA